MYFLLLLLVLQRNYFPVSIQRMATGHNYHTHVMVIGQVALVEKQIDGDLHIRLTDGKYFIVAECILSLPCTKPKVGQTVAVKGISRFDGEHKWYEVHPVENLVIQK